MSLPSIAVVGRPNVGKSSLFNTLVGKPISIVDPTAGVTRDRLIHRVRREGFHCNLIDTGGIGIIDEAKLEDDIHKQINRAIEHADLILFVVDGRDGVLPLDVEVASRLRKVLDRVLLVVNKIDTVRLETEVHQFLSLGVGDPIAFSAQQIRGLDDLMDAIKARLPEIAKGDDRESREAEEAAQGNRIRICLAGRRNVGKSSLTNALLGDDRMIVADLPGTTRDAVDIGIDTPEGSFTLIDTAGLRKRRMLSDDIEFYAACRTERAILRAHVVFLILDASQDSSIVDKQLARFVESEGKPVVLVLNKWDLAQQAGATFETYKKWLADRFPGLAHAPVITTSAITKFNVSKLLTLAAELHAEGQVRLGTGELNRLIEKAVLQRRPRLTGKGSNKIFYATQVTTCPPTILVFVGRADCIEAGYNRYLEHYIREHTAIKRIPLRIMFRTREGHSPVPGAPTTTSGLPKAEERATLVRSIHTRSRSEARTKRRGKNYGSHADASQGEAEGNSDSE